MALDFTLKKLQDLYTNIINKNYKIVTFAEYIKSDKYKNKKVIILRHDVDRKVINSLKMAIIERGMGVRASYYFRYKKDVFKKKIIDKISNKGHEVGYQYEVLSRTSGNLEIGIELLKKELEKFQEIVNIETICMHGSPFSKWDSRKLWNKYKLKNFGIIGEPYLDIDFNKVLYLTDTGRRWNGSKVSIRDKVNSNFKYNFKTTSDIIFALEKNILPNQIMMNIHPQRWNNSFIPWIKELIGQNIKNSIKYFFVKLR